MDYRFLGRSALRVSPLCLGSMMFGGPTDEPAARRIVDHARDQGINFIDTADVYNAGQSEEIVGRAIANDRDRWVLATKFGMTRSPWPNESGLSRKWIFQSVHNSLRRLGTDYIDILYIHRAYPNVPLEEAIRALGDLIAAGNIRYYGLSNFKGWRIAEVVRIADRLGIDRPVVSQPLYNLVNRSAEVEELPAARHYGLGVVPYSPLARGVLTAKYLSGQPPVEGSRAARADKRILEVELRAESLDIARRLQAHAETRGVTAADYALAWVLANKAVTALIAGPRTFEQWTAYFPALDFRLDAADEAFANALVTPGHPSTPGFTDPNYPVEGRFI